MKNIELFEDLMKYLMFDKNTIDMYKKCIFEDMSTEEINSLTIDDIKRFILNEVKVSIEQYFDCGNHKE